MTKRILVTGSEGFIGYHLLKNLTKPILEKVIPQDNDIISE